MKAVLLAAGKGTRLGTLTAATPKPLLPVRGTPVLQRHLEWCARNGVHHVLINTHHLAEAIRAFAGDGSRFGLQISYSFEPELLGTAGALNNFRPELHPDPRFLVIYGDNVFDFQLAPFLAFHLEKNGLGSIALHHRQDVSMSGIAVLDPNKRIVRFIEKPAPHEQVSNLVNAGIYLLESRVLDCIAGGFSDFGKDVFPRLLDAGEPLYGYEIPGTVEAIDTRELYEQTSTLQPPTP